MYWSRGFFLWMVQRKCRFRNLKRGDGTTQEFVSGTFRSVHFQFRLLAKYLISANNCGCSHINFGQTAVAEKLRNQSFAVSEILHLSGLKHLIDSNIARRAFYVRRSLKGLRKPFRTNLRTQIGMLFEPYFEHSSKWTSLVSHFLTCCHWNRKYWLCWQSFTAFGFAVIISTVGVFQVWAYVINNSSRLPLASVAGGSFYIYK